MLLKGLFSLHENNKNNNDNSKAGASRTQYPSPMPIPCFFALGAISLAAVCARVLRSGPDTQSGRSM